MVELCIHTANILYLLSFLGRDMLWLRTLTCGGLVLGIVFFTCQPMPLYGPTVWHVVFLFINALQIGCLVRERRQLRLSKEQEKVGEATFHGLSREELLTLLTHVMNESPAKVRDIHQVCHQELTKEERVLRSLAFSRLSRQELLNLLTRRLWNSIMRMRRSPLRASQDVAAPAPRPEIEVARASAS